MAYLFNDGQKNTCKLQERVTYIENVYICHALNLGGVGIYPSFLLPVVYRLQAFFMSIYQLQLQISTIMENRQVFPSKTCSAFL